MVKIAPAHNDIPERECWINEKSDWREIMKIRVIEYRYALTRVIACGDNSTGTDKPGSIIRDRLLTDDVGCNEINNRTAIGTVLSMQYC